jgi:hypothetical protein
MRGGGLRVLRPMSTAVHRSPNKLWSSNLVLTPNETYDCAEACSRGARGNRAGTARRGAVRPAPLCLQVL